MSFASDIYYVMTNDPSINALVNGGIHYEILRDNFNLTKKWIDYNFRRLEQVDCIGTKDVYTNYEVTTTIITQNSLDCVSISDLLVTYLNGAEYGGIIDIKLEDDGHVVEQEKNIFKNTLLFTAIYS